MKTLVIINTTFTGLHHWKHAPEAVSFLRHPHRHEFRVKVAVHEDHNFTVDERETEFILLKAFVTSFLPRLAKSDASFINGPMDLGETSCENIAHEIAEYLTTKGYTVDHVEVFEDGENGARFEP